jgi:hypothetical protein
MASEIPFGFAGALWITSLPKGYFFAIIKLNNITLSLDGRGQGEGELQMG